jgi:hypothetical protein
MKLLTKTSGIKIIPALTLLLIFTSTINAQVTIGSNAAPNSNAVLDLVSNANKGLLLPRVALTSTSSPSPLATHVAGMFVYNTATAGSGTSAVYPGIYFNNGTSWVSSVAAGTNIYNADGTLTANRTVSMDGNNLIFNGGNIGVGTSSPSTKLEVAGQIKVTGGSPGIGKVLTSDANGLATWKDPYAPNCENTIPTIYSTGVILNVPDNSQYIYVTINATSQCYAASASGTFYLDVASAKMLPVSNNMNASNDTTLYYSLQGLGNVTLQYSPSNKTIKAIDYGSVCAVGIFNWGLSGCWSPNYNPGTNVLTAWSLTGNATSSSHFLGTKNNTDLILKTNNTEQMRLTKEGKVGIGTSNPAYKLHVNGEIGANAYNCISDIRLKKEIKPLVINNDLVMKIHPVTYILKEDPQEQIRIGLIAQELEAIFPSLVKTGENGYKSVEYDKISLLLLSVVKQQQNQIEQIKQQLKKLEEMIK